MAIKNQKALISFGLFLSLFFFSSPATFALDFPFDEETWKSPLGAAGLAAHFQEFEFVFSDGSEELTVNFFLEGQDEINGTEVNVIRLTNISEGEAEKLLCWIDKEGKILRVLEEKSQEEIPAQFAGFMLEIFFLPLHLIHEGNFGQFLSEGNELVHLNPIGKEERAVGGLNASVYSYELEVPDEEGQISGVGQIEAGDFKDFQMIVGFRLEVADDSGKFLEYKINKISLH